jgi:hypothetical protein
VNSYKQWTDSICVAARQAHRALFNASEAVVCDTKINGRVKKKNQERPGISSGSLSVLSDKVNLVK